MNNVNKLGYTILFFLALWLLSINIYEWYCYEKMVISLLVYYIVGIAFGLICWSDNKRR